MANPYLDVLLEILSEDSETESVEPCSERNEDAEEVLASGVDGQPEGLDGEAEGPNVVIQGNNNIQAAAAERLPTSPVRSLLVLKYLSSSSAKRRQTKNAPCHFCNNDCSRLDLSQHLLQSLNCATLYQRKLHCKSIDSIMALLFDCEFCDSKVNKLFYHLEESKENETNCYRGYCQKFNLEAIRWFDKCLNI